MAKFGCPAIFIAMVRQFHDGMLARVKMMASFLIYSLRHLELSKAVY